MAPAEYRSPVLRALFEGLEKAMGPSLDSLASFAWTFGLLLVALQVLAPFARVAVQLMLTRAGLEQAWVAGCSTCGTRTVLAAECVKCGASLKVPALAKLFARNRTRRAGLQRAGWAMSCLGALLFLAGSLRLMAALAPSGPLERLFSGVALLAWAGIGFFLGRALGPRGGGPVARARELVFAAAAAALLGCALFLEQTVTPVPERVLAHVKVNPESIELNGAKLTITQPELGLELQVVEHPGLGFGRVLPLAWVGSTRSPIELSGTDAWLRDKTWAHAQTLISAGAQVKRRTETFPLAIGARYEVVLREHDVLLRPAK